jgi:hypothetical protein
MISLISFDHPYGEIGCVGESSFTGLSAWIDGGGGGKDERVNAVIQRTLNERA